MKCVRLSSSGIRTKSKTKIINKNRFGMDIGVYVVKWKAIEHFNIFMTHAFKGMPNGQTNKVLWLSNTQCNSPASFRTGPQKLLRSSTSMKLLCLTLLLNARLLLLLLFAFVQYFDSSSFLKQRGKTREWKMMQFHMYTLYNATLDTCTFSPFNL